MKGKCFPFDMEDLDKDDKLPLVNNITYYIHALNS